jgi:hypothetical protein
VLPVSPGSHVHFYLTNIYYKGCVLSSNFCFNPFLYQRVYVPNPFTPSVTHYTPCHTRFCPIGLLSFFALMSILDGLFHSLSITLFFTCSATTLSRPPLRRCVHCQSRLLSSVCFYGLPAPFKLNLCASNKQFRTFFVSMSQINRNLSFHSPIFTCRLLVQFSLLLTCFSLSAYHTEYRKYNILKREKRDTYL